MEELREPEALWIRMTDEEDDEQKAFEFCTADAPDAERITGINLL